MLLKTLLFYHIAGQLFISGLLLFYTAIIAPVQVFIWEFDEEECDTFPTLLFDVVVDIFFLVRFGQNAFLHLYWTLNLFNCYSCV